MAAHFHQAKTRQLTKLDACAVTLGGITQFLFDGALIALFTHVDKVDHDQTAHITQTQLARDFFGGFRVGVECGVFDIGATGGLGRVNVNRHQGFGLIDNDGAA